MALLAAIAAVVAIVAGAWWAGRDLAPNAIPTNENQTARDGSAPTDPHGSS